MDGRQCIGKSYTITAVIEGVSYERWPFGPAMEGSFFDGRAGYGATRCNDCATPLAGLHHPGCDMERCPRCMYQAISCGCRWDGDEPDAEFDPADLKPESPYARRS
jgi:hypothetical protein